MPTSPKDITKTIAGIPEKLLVTQDVSAPISAKASMLKRTLVKSYLTAFGLPVLSSLPEDKQKSAAAAFGGSVNRFSGAGVVLAVRISNCSDELHPSLVTVASRL